MMFWYGHDMGWWGYAGMGIAMLLFWALLIVGIVALIRYAANDRQGSQFPQFPPPPPPTAEEVLAGRFARGEISETEYRERLTVLRDHTRN